jgi:superfamily II DNA helicase RecQ
LDVKAIAAQLGLSDAQMRRALAALEAKGLIGYHAAFQGRGIRLLDAPPARALRIDTKELAARAAAEQWKLRRVIDYCYHKSCLRTFILKYFGDRKQSLACQSCSVCAPTAARFLEEDRVEAKPAGTLRVGRASRANANKPSELEHFIIEQAPSGVELREQLKARAASKRALSQAESASAAPPTKACKLNPAQTTVVIKILSCIARIEREYGRSRFGKGTVAAVLRGSTSKQVLEGKLDRLSTYGLLRDMRQDEITAYIKALIDAGCIAIEKGMYPTVSLTDFGREVMKSRAEVMLELPD